MNANYKQLSQKLDLCGQTQREAIRKQEQARQQPQQVAVDSLAAREGGLRSHDEASYRRIDLAKLRDSDPILYFYIVANSRPEFA